MKNLSIVAVIIVALVATVPALADHHNQGEQAMAKVEGKYVHFKQPEVAHQKGDKKAIEGIKEAFSKIVEAASRLDMETLGKYYSDDLTVIDAGGRTMGWSAYQEKVLPMQKEMLVQDEAGAMVSGYPSIDGLAITAPTGNTGWATYRFRMTANTEKGPTPIFGYGTIIFHRGRDGWKAHHIQTAARPLMEGEVLE